MIRRLFMTLLVLCLALPAAALPVGHDHAVVAPAPHGTGHHLMTHDHEQSHAADSHGHAHSAPAAHDCIGCVADSGGVATPEKPFEWREAAPRPALAEAPMGLEPSPDTPPPRP